MPITQDSATYKFTDGQGAELEYQLPAHGVIEFTHTFVPESARGRGVGEALAKAGLDYARQQHLQAIPSCPFVADYIQKHPEYADLVA